MHGNIGCCWFTLHWIGEDRFGVPTVAGGAIASHMITEGPSPISLPFIPRKLENKGKWARQVSCSCCNSNTNWMASYHNHLSHISGSKMLAGLTLLWNLWGESFLVSLWLQLFCAVLRCVNASLNISSFCGLPIFCLSTSSLQEDVIWH